MRTERLRREYEVDLRWTVFPLHPEIPEEGMELADLFRGRNFDFDAMHRRLAAVAAEVGLTLAAKTRIFNSRRVQELGKWAESMGKGDEFRRRAYHAYFAEGKNFALQAELEFIAENAGLPGEEVYDVLAQGLFAEAVDGDWERARRMAVTAVPFHLCGERTLVGFHPYDDYVKLVTE